MLSKKITLLIAIIFFTLFSVTNAATLYDFYKNQYVSFNGGATYVNKIFYKGRLGQLYDSGFLGGGGNLFIGSWLSSFFGLELGFNYFSFGSLGGMTLIAVNGRFTELLGHHVMLFEKIGAGFGEVTTRILTEVTSDNFVPSLGLGIGYGIAQYWMLTMEFNGAWFPNSTSNCNGVIGGWTLGATRYFTW